MSGRRIDDHSFWAPGKDKGSVFPKGAHTKAEHTAEGAGAVGEYQDTTEAIKRTQEKGEGKAKGHKMKDGFRY